MMKKFIRVTMLNLMENYVADVIGDDDIYYNMWKSCGLPDGYTVEDVREIAEDDELFLDALECFVRCLKASK